MSLMSENYINIWGIYCQQGLPGDVYCRDNYNYINNNNYINIFA